LAHQKKIPYHEVPVDVSAAESCSFPRSRSMDEVESLQILDLGLPVQPDLTLTHIGS
jgi:hypothetical protein